MLLFLAVAAFQVGLERLYRFNLKAVIAEKVQLIVHLSFDESYLRLKPQLAKEASSL